MGEKKTVKYNDGPFRRGAQFFLKLNNECNVNPRDMGGLIYALSDYRMDELCHEYYDDIARDICGLELDRKD